MTQRNVLDDLGFSPENAAVLKFKAQLYREILKCSQKYSQEELQAILGEPKPRERTAEWEDREQERRQAALLRRPSRNRNEG
jgi:hypothetical protein